MSQGDASPLLESPGWITKALVGPAAYPVASGSDR